MSRIPISRGKVGDKGTVAGGRTDGRQDRQAGMTSDVGEASGQWEAAGAGGYRATLISSPIGRNNALLAAAMVVAAP